MYVNIIYMVISKINISISNVCANLGRYNPHNWQILQMRLFRKFGVNLKMYTYLLPGSARNITDVRLKLNVHQEESSLYNMNSFGLYNTLGHQITVSCDITTP